jgi:hypothetical protein
MRRAQPRPSRNERIIYGSDGENHAAVARTRVPRGQAKIRSLDDGNRDAVHAFEDSLRRNWAADVGVGVGADVAEAAAALSHGPMWRSGRRAASEAPAGKRPPSSAAKAGAPAKAAKFSLTALPKPLRHLLAGAFSGGACAAALRRAPSRSPNPARWLEYSCACAPRPPAPGVSKTLTSPLEVVRMKLMVGAKGARTPALRPSNAWPSRQPALICAVPSRQACASARWWLPRGARAACAASLRETWRT